MRIGSTSNGMSSGSCEPSASRNTVTGVRTCGMARRMASPFPDARHPPTRVAPLLAATSAVPSVEWPTTTSDRVGERPRPLDDVADARRLLLRGDHHRHVGRHVVRDRLVQMRLNDGVGVTGDVHRARSGIADVEGDGAAHLRPPASAPAGQKVAENALIRFAGRPALRALPFPDLALHLRRLGSVPDRIQAHAGFPQAADRPRVGDAWIDDAPRIDEAARSERMAGHRRPAGLRETCRGTRDKRSRATAPASADGPGDADTPRAPARTSAGSGHDACCPSLS